MGATRAALAAATDEQVVGWVDLTSPHLVDLLDELVSGPGGNRLVAVRSNAVAHRLEELPVRRGINTLLDTHLAFHTTDPELRDALRASWPALQLHPT
ncbi:MAG: hypothetical protein R2733_02515 [Acidimicrobiales bacterium]